MLAIRMQRTGRKGHAQFRVIVQDSRFSPSSGRVVAYVGNYDPHTKAATLDSEKISNYLEKGAQPSDRAARLFQKEGIKLPGWYKASPQKQKSVRNADKRRSTRPAGAPEPEKAPVTEEAEAETAAPAEEPKTDAPAEETPAEAEKPAEEPAAEPKAPAEEPAKEA